MPKQTPSRPTRPSRLHRLLWLPLQIVSVLSWDKSFRNNPVIGSRVLNRLGLHVARVLVSHLLFSFRLWLLSPLLGGAERRQFKTQGYLLIRDFLPPAAFAALAREVRGYRGELRAETEGRTLTERVYLTQEVLTQLPECKRLVECRSLLKLLRYTSSKNRIPFFYLENIVHEGSANPAPDPQKDLHTDTFHPCVKAWLYLEAVTPANGPFTFVPGSQRLTWRRLRWEYRQSLLAAETRVQPPQDRYWDGSFRVSPADIEALGYGEPILLTVPANSLLIANVHGIHRRGDADPGASRLTVWMQARDNPFNPLFSPFPQATARVFEFVWSRYTARRTASQVQTGAWAIRQDGFSLRPESPCAGVDEPPPQSPTMR